MSARLSEKSRRFVESVCTALDNDPRLTLLEYAEDMGIGTRNAYTLLRKAVGGDQRKYNNYLQRPYYSRRKTTKKIAPTGGSTKETEKKKAQMKENTASNEEMATVAVVSENTKPEWTETSKSSLTEKNVACMANTTNTSDITRTKEIPTSNETGVKEIPTGNETGVKEIPTSNETGVKEIPTSNETGGNELEKLKEERNNYLDNLAELRKWLEELNNSIMELCKHQKEFDSEEQNCLEMIDLSWKLMEKVKEMNDVTTEIKTNTDYLTQIVDKIDSLKKIVLVTNKSHTTLDYFGDIIFVEEFSYQKDTYENNFKKMAMNPEADDLSLKEVKWLAQIVTVMSEIKKKNTSHREFILLASEKEKEFLTKLGYEC